MSSLRDRGVTATQYVERFGGYGRTRDIGFITWQVALCLNHMQEENFLAARDALALRFVCQEQTAMDNGKMEVGLLLAWSRTRTSVDVQRAVPGLGCK